MKHIRFLSIFIITLVTLSMWACAPKTATPDTAVDTGGEFQYRMEQFADLYIARYRVPGFDELTLQQKKLIYYLSEAALVGRDIFWDQNYKYNLAVRRTLETIVEGYTGDRSTDEFDAFMVYTKRIWFSNGIHHHYSTAKIMPGFSEDYFDQLIAGTSADFPWHKVMPQGKDGETFIREIIFDPTIAPKKVNLTPGADLLATSATNFYDGVTQAEATAFYAAKTDADPKHPVQHGLNSLLTKENGQLVEKVWKVGGMYTEAIERIVYWLEKAITVAENNEQQTAFELLVKYYKSGDLKDFDDYCIAWVKDVNSTVDVINGFIEVYADPIGYHGSFESVVSFKDMEASRRIEAIGDEAQWFEDNSSIMDAHKKANVKGISAKVITVVMESGDASPSTPIGINLPNPNWIRSEYGSKSVSLGNIINGYGEANRGSGALAEFAYSQAEIEGAKKWGTLAGNLHTDMHEVIGHASGIINPGIGTPKETLKSYSSAMEEGRADLVALYFLLDTKLIDIGVMTTLDVGKTAYDSYIRNGLMYQLRRIKLGDDIEESHMRNRQMVASWVYEKGEAENVIERKIRDGKTYFIINDYERLRELFGELLQETQRIKSEGDYEAAKRLIETYGVKVDPKLHAEVLDRFGKLNLAAYGGFINPRIVPVMDGSEIVDVRVEYVDSFTDQMMEYARKYSFLPTRF